MALLIMLPAVALADTATESPGAVSRTNAENFKDRALASCLASAYRNAPDVARDTSVAASVLTEWAYFDTEKAGPALDSLIEKYLQRNYRNPVEGYEGVRFDLLKCLDLFHSRDLDGLVKAAVPHPGWVGSKRR